MVYLENTIGQQSASPVMPTVCLLQHTRGREQELHSAQQEWAAD